MPDAPAWPPPPGSLGADNTWTAEQRFAQGITLPDLTGAAAKGIDFGADITLYRLAANTLRTDDSFQALGNVRAQDGLAAQTRIGAYGPSSEAAITFGSANDTVLYRSAADTLRTDDALLAGTYLEARAGSAKAIRLNDSVGDGTGKPSIFFASGVGTFDTNLFRDAANVLKTDDDLHAALDFTARAGAAAQVRAGAAGPASEAGIVFGSAADTNLYRSAASVLKTDDDLHAALNVTARAGAATQVRAGAVGPAAEAAIVFGSAADTSLYRAGAGVLATPGSLIADGAMITWAANGFWWSSASAAQTTVGAAGAAAALPATPATYLKVTIPGGSVAVIPAYAPS